MKKSTRIFAAVISIVLVVAMVAGLFVAAFS
jgi:hypothetical protein